MFTRKSVVKIGVIGIVIGLGIVSFFSFETKSKKALGIKTYKNENGWGYDVYVDGSLLVHQPSIPSLPGNKGFISETEAQKVAELVAGKIKQNIIPPTVDREELKRLGAVK